MVAYLVTGNPGSGKTTVASELLRRGLTALDADYVDGLAHYEDSAGRSLARPDVPLRPSMDWLRRHRWVWNRSRLAEIVIASPTPSFVCGIALNIADVVDLFERLFLLKIDGPTQEERLAAYDLANAPGRTEAGRQQIREGRETFQHQMLALGAAPIDGSADAAAVVDDLLRLIAPP